MTPERAREISQAHYDTTHLGDWSVAAWVINAILAACREERHVALTEAALATGCVYADQAFKSILALRDKEQP